MAIVVGDRVRPKLTSTTLGTDHLNPQPPVLAVVTRIEAGAPDIIFATVADNGTTWSNNASAIQAQGVRADALDQITSPDAAVKQAFMDKVVVGMKSTPAAGQPEIEVQYSSEYVGEVVDVFNVNGSARVLIRTNAGLYYELGFTRVSVLPNR